MGCLGKGTQEGKERGQGGSGSNKHRKIESKRAKKHQMHVNSCETVGLSVQALCPITGVYLTAGVKTTFLTIFCVNVFSCVPVSLAGCKPATSSPWPSKGRISWVLQSTGFSCL